MEEEEEESGDEGAANHDQNNHGVLVKPPPARGFCSALRSCCCCVSPSEKLKVVVDPENGTMSLNPQLVVDDSCGNKFMDVWTWFRSHTRSFIYSFWFENGIMLCIVINTLCLALDSPGIGEDLDNILSKINDVSHVSV